MTTSQEVKLRLVESCCGFDDYVVADCAQGIRRITVGHGSSAGEPCNVYGPNSSKRGAPFKGSAEATLSAFLGGAKVVLAMEPSPEHAAFEYQLLARLKQDCAYYMGHGNRAKKHLWAGEEAAQTAKMRELYAGLAEKPQWISLEDIARYESAMSRQAEAGPR